MDGIQAALCTEFLARDHQEQLDLLKEDGVYIGKLREGDGTRLLYQYQTIYVEIVYLLHRTIIKEVHCFADTAILDSYFSSDDFETNND